MNVSSNSDQCTINTAPMHRSIWNDSCNSSIDSYFQLMEEMDQVKPLKQRKRKVRFCQDKKDLLDIHMVPSVKNMSQAEINEIWYDKFDYDDIKRQIVIFLRKVQQGKAVDITQETGRGLEFRTKSGAEARQRYKREAIRAVLEEQDRQVEDDEDDDEQIAIVSMAATAATRQQARELGTYDEEEIQKDVDKLRKKLEANNTFSSAPSKILREGARGIQSIRRSFSKRDSFLKSSDSDSTAATSSSSGSNSTNNSKNFLHKLTRQNGWRNLPLDNSNRHQSNKTASSQSRSFANAAA